MSHQLVLAWTVDVTGTPISAAQAAARLSAIKFYENTSHDPVLGQFFGVTVDSDATTTPTATTARRTVTLNLDATNDPTAPPVFPCHPKLTVPPVPPYPLRRNIPLSEGNVIFSLALGSTVVKSSMSQLANVRAGDVVGFLRQTGVLYVVAAITANAITLTTPYTGRPGGSAGFKEVAAPVTRPALYSTSDLDTTAVATVPPIVDGSGARTVVLTYLDSTGAGPFTSTVSLTGTRPATVSLEDGGIDLATIVSMKVASAGAFGNNVGQLTLVELSEDLPELPPNTPFGTGIGPAQAFSLTWKTLTADAQMLIREYLAYMPPSYFALSDQAASQGASPSTPSDPKLATLFAQFVDPQTAQPPPGAPLPPTTVPLPTFLSGQWTRTIKLALAGAKVTSEAITFV